MKLGGSAIHGKVGVRNLPNHSPNFCTLGSLGRRKGDQALIWELEVSGWGGGSFESLLGQCLGDILCFVSPTAAQSESYDLTREARSKNTRKDSSVRFWLVFPPLSSKRFKNVKS